MSIIIYANLQCWLSYAHFCRHSIDHFVNQSFPISLSLSYSIFHSSTRFVWLHFSQNSIYFHQILSNMLIKQLFHCSFVFVEIVVIIIVNMYTPKICFIQLFFSLMRVSITTYWIRYQSLFMSQCVCVCVKTEIEFVSTELDGIKRGWKL